MPKNSIKVLHEEITSAVIVDNNGEVQSQEHTEKKTYSFSISFPFSLKNPTLQVVPPKSNPTAYLPIFLPSLSSVYDIPLKEIIRCHLSHLLAA